MRFVQFIRKSAPNFLVPGAELGEGGSVVDLSHIAPSILAIIQGGYTALSSVTSYLTTSPPAISRQDISLAAPITGMDKVLCIGMNYRDHCEEQGAPVPTEPLVFNKFPSCVCGPSDDIPLPACTQQLDWEVELTVVIGKTARNVTKEDALSCVLGYTVAHDVSARDWQLKRNGGQWLAGKAMDNFCPLGPALVTRDEIENPHNLNLSCIVNGDVKQDSNTKQLVFGIPEVVAWVSQFTTLLPGDIILTGTPPGVGVFKKPPQFLKKGDVVECKVEKIGSIVNKVV
jgi:2-keto-4-pentenoate hydratase/2-oxohepta-3-ene-1,7-dioic acid hydratase in catechol pathway